MVLSFRVVYPCYSYNFRPLDYEKSSRRNNMNDRDIPKTQILLGGPELKKIPPRWPFNQALGGCGFRTVPHCGFRTTLSQKTSPDERSGPNRKKELGGVRYTHLSSIHSRAEYFRRERPGAAMQSTVYISVQNNAYNSMVPFTSRQITNTGSGRIP